LQSVVVLPPVHMLIWFSENHNLHNLNFDFTGLISF